MKLPLWKIKFRFGLLKTPFRHYAVFVEGFPEPDNEQIIGFRCFCLWASSSEEAAHLVMARVKETGFGFFGDLHIHENTPPKEPPGETAAIYFETLRTYPAEGYEPVPELDD